MKLCIAALGKRLGGRRVLDDVCLTVDAGEVVALVGPNGSGKSTLLRIIAGVLSPTTGDVTLDGVSLLERPALRRHVGFVPEGADPLPHLAIGELLELTASLRFCAPPPTELLERLGIAPLVEQRLGTLSLGQRRRACLAAALVGDPWLLVLDEPTNGLSTDGVAMLQALLTARNARGQATLLATHDAGFAAALEARIIALASPPRTSRPSRGASSPAG